MLAGAAVHEAGRERARFVQGSVAVGRRSAGGRGCERRQSGNVEARATVRSVAARRVVVDIRRRKARRPRKAGARSQPEPEGRRRACEGIARDPGGGAGGSLSDHRRGLRADARKAVARLATAAGRREHPGADVVARAGNRIVRGRSVRAGVRCGRRGARRIGRSGCVAAFGATDIAGRRRAELLQPARIRFGTRCLHAHRESA